MQALLDNYAAVLLATVVGLILVGTALIGTRVLAPFSQSKQKGISYECGMLPVGRRAGRSSTSDTTSSPSCS